VTKRRSAAPLAEVVLVPGIRQFLRSDHHGPEFVVRELRHWLDKLGTGTLYIEPGSPWENGYCESFNGKRRRQALSTGERAAGSRWDRLGENLVLGGLDCGANGFICSPAGRPKNQFRLRVNSEKRKIPDKFDVIGKQSWHVPVARIRLPNDPFLP
jgi:transposase InsO family protein